MPFPGNNDDISLRVDTSDTSDGADRSYGIADDDIVHIHLSCDVRRAIRFYCTSHALRRMDLLFLASFPEYQGPVRTGIYTGRVFPVRAEVALVCLFLCQVPLYRPI